MWHKFSSIATRAWLGALVVAMVPAGVARAVTETVTFQEGVNGYTNTEMVRVGDNGTDDGSTVPGFFVDGYRADPASADSTAMIRFDNIIGNGPGQVPSGAFILDARLRIHTNTVGNAQSPGPWGVAGMLTPFSPTTDYFGDFTCNCELGSRGAWWEDDYTTRPVAAFGGNFQGELGDASIRPLVQNWANGQANHGVVVQTGFGTSLTVTSGTVDGWGIIATGHPLADRRPELEITYTTEPVEVNTFQRDLNGYTGDMMAWVQSGSNVFGTDVDPDFRADDITTNGLNVGQAFLDGLQFTDTTGTASSPDDLALIKFDNVFGAGATQAPSDVQVAKAWLVVTTGDEHQNAASSGDWTVHRMLTSWDDTTLYSDIGDTPGLQIHDGDISAALDTQEGIISGSEVWFDVTNYLEGVRNGTPDNGLAVRTTSTSDGWMIHFNGSDVADARPRLVVASGMAGSVGGLAGDFNNDGSVDAADYTIWRDNLGSGFDLGGNGNETGASAGVVDQDDYVLWKDMFGSSANGGASVEQVAVPEPATWMLTVMAGLAALAIYRKR